MMKSYLCIFCLLLIACAFCTLTVSAQPSNLAEVQKEIEKIESTKQNRTNVDTFRINYDRFDDETEVSVTFRYEGLFRCTVKKLTDSTLRHMVFFRDRPASTQTRAQFLADGKRFTLWDGVSLASGLLEFSLTSEVYAQLFNYKNLEYRIGITEYKMDLELSESCLTVKRLAEGLEPRPKPTPAQKSTPTPKPKTTPAPPPNSISSSYLH